jgi:hypothetical protein
MNALRIVPVPTQAPGQTSVQAAVDTISQHVVSTFIDFWYCDFSSNDDFRVSVRGPTVISRVCDPQTTSLENHQLN